MEGPYAPLVAPDVPLVERKRRQARQRIIDAADELFLANGFDGVSVSDIAERAEVGRMTFFRYFGDKQEVVFAKQEELLAMIAAAQSEAAVSAPRTVAEAIEQLRPVVLELCARVTADPESFTRHYELLASHRELHARDALKTQQAAGTLRALLVHRGCTEDVALLAAEVAVACYQTARQLAGDPRTLPEKAATAFDQLHTLTSSNARTSAGSARGDAGNR